MSVCHFWFKEVLLGVVTVDSLKFGVYSLEYKDSDRGLERLSRISQLLIGSEDSVIDLRSWAPTVCLHKAGKHGVG